MNGGGSDVLTVIVLLIAGYFIAALIFAATVTYMVLLFLTFALSVLCFLTLDYRLTIGRLSLAPEESRPFVMRGVIGTLLLPCFALFCEYFFEMRVPPKWWPHLFAVGWTLGSVGIGLIEDGLVGDAHDYERRERSPVIEHDERPALSGPREAPRSASASGAALTLREASREAPPQSGPVRACGGRCFTFATWDDEEELRRRAAAMFKSTPAPKDEAPPAPANENGDGPCSLGTSCRSIRSGGCSAPTARSASRGRMPPRRGSPALGRNGRPTLTLGDPAPPAEPELTPEAEMRRAAGRAWRA